MKINAILTVFFLVFCFCACGGGASSNSTDTDADDDLPVTGESDVDSDIGGDESDDTPSIDSPLLHVIIMNEKDDQTNITDYVYDNEGNRRATLEVLDGHNGGYGGANYCSFDGTNTVYYAMENAEYESLYRVILNGVTAPTTELVDTIDNDATAMCLVSDNETYLVGRDSSPFAEEYFTFQLLDQDIQDDDIDYDYAYFADGLVGLEDLNESTYIGGESHFGTDGEDDEIRVTRIVQNAADEYAMMETENLEPGITASCRIDGKTLVDIELHPNGDYLIVATENALTSLRLNNETILARNKNGNCLFDDSQKVESSDPNFPDIISFQLFEGGRKILVHILDATFHLATFDETNGAITVIKEVSEARYKDLRLHSHANIGVMADELENSISVVRFDDHYSLDTIDSFATKNDYTAVGGILSVKFGSDLSE